MTEYKCRKEGCEKIFRSRSGRLYHERHATHTTPTVQKSTEKPKNTEQPLNEINTESNVNSGVQIKEVSFVTKKLNKKQEEEPEYECGECGAEFNTKSKYCPECGIKFSE